MPITLAECMRDVPPQARLTVITKYWRARERAARYEALAEQLEQLNVLPSLAIGQRDQPGMAEAGVRLQSARAARGRQFSTRILRYSWPNMN